MDRNKVVLVDENDLAIEEMNKLKAHQKGKLHRAFSIFLFNADGKMLIHQRAKHKYHGAGLWTNTCCSHPQWGENIKEGALERLNFEMGIQCDIQKVFSFIYNSPVENNLIEYEYDHVFIGYTNNRAKPNIDEVQNYQWIYPIQLQEDIQIHPYQYTFWFKKALPILLGKLQNNFYPYE